MVYRFETFADDNEIVVLQFLKVSHISVIPKKFCESPKLKSGCVNYEHFCESGHICRAFVLQYAQAYKLCASYVYTKK